MLSVRSCGEVAADERYETVLVPVRSEQLTSMLPILIGTSERSYVLFFGNTIGKQDYLTSALGERALFGFPAAGGVRDGTVIRYTLIRQQKTMLGEAVSTTGPRLCSVSLKVLEHTQYTRISVDINGWMYAHTAFVVPIGFALYRFGTDVGRLGADVGTMRSMVQATREAFRALVASGNREIPTNLRILYLRLPTAFVVRYWQRVMASPRGELWFAADSRAAPNRCVPWPKNSRPLFVALAVQHPILTTCCPNPRPDHWGRVLSILARPLIRLCLRVYLSIGIYLVAEP